MSQSVLFKRLQDHLNWRARLLAEGQYDALAVTYRFPVQVRLGRLSLQIKTREDLILQMHRKRAALLRQGLSLPRPVLQTADLHPVNGIRRAWVRWLSDLAGEPRESRAIFGFAEEGGSFVLVSVQYDTLLLPEFEKPSSHRRLHFSQ
ncbi:MAG: hypothetical protein E6Q73_01730 [Pseudorhodobacter sp.]|nr:MAG: hypothetical protein E6Q73_01730 [Pseudorhodobacter sp.]